MKSYMYPSRLTTNKRNLWSIRTKPSKLSDFSFVIIPGNKRNYIISVWVINISPEIRIVGFAIVVVKFNSQYAIISLVIKRIKLINKKSFFFKEFYLFVVPTNSIGPDIL